MDSVIREVCERMIITQSTTQRLHPLGDLGLSRSVGRPILARPQHAWSGLRFCGSAHGTDVVSRALAAKWCQPCVAL